MRTSKRTAGESGSAAGGAGRDWGWGAVIRRASGSFPVRVARGPRPCGHRPGGRLERIRPKLASPTEVGHAASLTRRGGATYVDDTTHPGRGPRVKATPPPEPT